MWGENQNQLLVNKIILHAAKEKCWFTGSTPIELEQFNVEIDVEDENPLTQNMRQNQNHQLLNMLLSGRSC
jgi:hypothetical protein